MSFHIFYHYVVKRTNDDSWREKLEVASDGISFSGWRFSHSSMAVLMVEKFYVTGTLKSSSLERFRVSIWHLSWAQKSGEFMDRELRRLILHPGPDTCHPFFLSGSAAKKKSWERHTQWWCCSSCRMFCTFQEKSFCDAEIESSIIKQPGVYAFDLSLSDE